MVLRLLRHPSMWPVLLAALTASVLLTACGSRSEVAVPAGRASWSELTGGSDGQRLNVILVTIDTLRADRLSSYGHPSGITPNIDRWAAEGIRFTDASSTVPFTLPAHSSIMTGTYPPYHGVRENVGYFLDESLPTLASELAQGGWTTGGFVSAFVLDSRWGIGRGFDTYFDDFDPDETRQGNLGSVQRPGPDTLAAALDWLDGEAERPFFLWLHLYDPHDPYTPPEPYRSRYRHPYDGEVAYTDSLIGQLHEALEHRGLLATSLVVLTSDHGEGLGQHQEGFHGFFIYDSTIRVPLIIRPPFPRLAGRVVDATVSHVDLLPTVLEAVGLPVPASVQGSSLLPWIVGDVPADSPPRQAYSESLYPFLHYGWAPLRSLRSDGYKFIDAPRPELFHLSADPEESHNALLDDRRRSRQLKDALDALIAEIETGAISAQTTDLDSETMRQLQALGYMAGRGGMDSEAMADRDRADPKDRIRLHQLVMAAQSDLGKEDFAAAESKLLEALATDDSLLDAHQMLGSIALQREEPEAAITHFQDALAEKSDHKAAILGLANAYRRLDREAEALVGYQRALEIDPTDSNAAIAAADLLVAGGDEAAAGQVLERALDQQRPAPILFSRLGELVFSNGDSDRAAELLRRALAGNEKLAPAHFNLAVIYEEEGRLEDAIGHYERTLELAPKHYQAMFNLGRLLGALGQPDRQQELYQSAIEANPDFHRGYIYLAKLIMDRGGDLSRAESLTREALHGDTERHTGPLGYFLLADILNRQGRSAEAREAVEKGREIQQRGG